VGKESFSCKQKSAKEFVKTLWRINYFPGNSTFFCILFIFFHFFLPSCGFSFRRLRNRLSMAFIGPEVGLYAGFGIFVFYSIFLF
jgi:hypothetical protein